MLIEEDCWRGRRVLLTGHTGFKGAWLSLWLHRLGACVSGVAPGPPSEPSLYGLANVAAGMVGEHSVDVRDRDGLSRALADAQPEVVIHLAAQPMVRRALLDPAATFETNVIGTVNLLEAVRAAGSVGAVVVVTSDKCYENPGAGARPFHEQDPLGGSDPYSASKACAEIVATSYRCSFFTEKDGPRLATARAGNVIGGGDWGEDRLLPDAVRVASGIAPAPLAVRNPQAVRPWQHVLNPLMGYLMLAQRLLDGLDVCEAWNFGPPQEDARTVADVLSRLQEIWDGMPAWEADAGVNPREAGWLALDSSKALQRLGWRPVWELDRGLVELVGWHRAQLAGQDARLLSQQQIEQFTRDADKNLHQ